jgi:hypothetical protein
MFPNMDPDRALESRVHCTAWDLANETLREMGDRFFMPRQSLDYLAELYRYYCSEKARRKISNNSCSGEGLKKYKSQGFEGADVELDTPVDLNWSQKRTLGDRELS